MEVSFFIGSQAVFPAVIHQLFGHSLFLAACLFMELVILPSTAYFFFQTKYLLPKDSDPLTECFQ